MSNNLHNRKKVGLLGPPFPKLSTFSKLVERLSRNLDLNTTHYRHWDTSWWDNEVVVDVNGQLIGGTHM